MRPIRVPAFATTIAATTLAATTLAGCAAQQNQQALAPSTEIQSRILAVETGLLPWAIYDNVPARHTLAERMADLHVQGVSIAVMHNGKIEWAKGYGTARPDGAQVTAETLFQAGSISKPVAAFAALRLVEQGKMSLDADINTYLTSWTLPASDLSKGKAVTLRQLLTHTGGISVHGFAGYAAGAPVPSLVQVLNGSPPANTLPIRIEAEPGVKWTYSGGGYTIMQQAMVDVSRMSFPALMHDSVLAPAGMTRSTYEQPLPVAARANAAEPFDAKGLPIAGGAHTYPEMAAAGLWTTPTELARYAIEVRAALQNKSSRVLSQAMTRQMLTADVPTQGLGPRISGPADTPWFGHSGRNAGFSNDFFVYETSGDGIFIMTNSDVGSLLIAEIERAAAEVYGWPDHRAVVKQVTQVDPKILATYVGAYTLAPNREMAIRLENGQLVSQATGEDPVPLLAESPTKFFPPEFEAELEFVEGDAGNPPNLVIHQGEVDHKAPRKLSS
jgi:CubicO group peptidase (beta-lactamase class C family)